MKRSSSSRLVLVLAYAFLFTVCISAQDLTPKFDEYLSAIAKQGKFTGSALVSRDGKVVFSRGYGRANEELEVANTPQTKFRLGSITKQFTAAAIMLLQERGKLSVTDSICKYIDKCPEAWKEITIHNLLSHTSGIPNFTSLPSYTPNMHAPVTNDTMLERFRDKPLDFKPSEKMSYSNSGYFLLGVIVEKAGGESYESYLQKNLFEPLGMSSSGYDRPNRILKNRASGYSFTKNDRVNAAYLDMTQPGGAGALYSTVEDLFAWNEALYGGKVVSAKSLEAMTTPIKNNYAYGLVEGTNFNRKTISHGGGINGFNTQLIRFLNDKVTVVVLRNQDYGGPGPGKIANDLAGILFGEKVEIPTEPVLAKVDPKLYDAYTGQYELRPDFILTITREGERLMAAPTGQPPAELFPESETKFFLRVVDARVTFVKDASGKVTHLILHQGGDREAKKVK